MSNALTAFRIRGIQRLVMTRRGMHGPHPLFRGSAWLRYENDEYESFLGRQGAHCGNRAAAAIVVWRSLSIIFVRVLLEIEFIAALPEVIRQAVPAVGKYVRVSGFGVATTGCYVSISSPVRSLRPSTSGSWS
jgi:hypothetical protein